MLVRTKNPQDFSHASDVGLSTEAASFALQGVDVAGNANQRNAQRRGVLLGARLDVGGSALDCIVLDISPRGARLQFAAPVTVPDLVRLLMRDGSRYDARRCWGRGNQVGLEFITTASLNLNDAAVERARVMLERVRATDPAAWLPALRAERYFGDEALRQAAEAAEIAHLRLVATLRGHSGGS